MKSEDGMRKLPMFGKSEKTIVYIREADREALPQHLRDLPGKLFALHDPQGACIALTEDRNVAFALARQNDLQPVSVH